MNLLLSRMDEPQRRWYVALESLRVGHGGEVLLSEITGLNVETIRRGREELEHELQDRPADRIRLPGAGRPPVEKKIPPSPPT
jgi:Mn-dependent DtxR family transcriptional regulator